MSVTVGPRTLPPPPADLAPDTFAARLYEMMAPLAAADFDNQWSLLILMNSIGVQFQLVETLVRDTADGPGWSALMDVERCPTVALPWLAQLVGVRLLPGGDDAANRTRIQSTAGFKRGTPDALKAAAAATLIGGKSVFLYERDGSSGHPESPEFAYCLTVVTYLSQTPNQAQTLAALMAQKPGGLLLTYVVIDGQTYQQVASRFATYAALAAGYPDYAAVAADQPAS